MIMERSGNRMKKRSKGGWGSWPRCDRGLRVGDYISFLRRQVFVVNHKTADRLISITNHRYQWDKCRSGRSAEKTNDYPSQC
jgi:hypothetical protein